MKNSAFLLVYSWRRLYKYSTLHTLLLPSCYILDWMFFQRSFLLLIAGIWLKYIRIEWDIGKFLHPLHITVCCIFHLCWRKNGRGNYDIRPFSHPEWVTLPQYPNGINFIPPRKPNRTRGIAVEAQGRSQQTSPGYGVVPAVRSIL